MSTAKEVLDNLGEDPEVVEQSAAVVQQYCELRDREVELPSSIEVYGTPLHRFQMVKEEIEMPMGSDETMWVITGFDDDAKEITLKVPGPWDQKTITYEEFELGDYEPQYHDYIDGEGNVISEPLWGY